MKNIAVFASGKGTNFNAIIKARKSGYLRVNIRLLICDNPKARCLKIADNARIKAVLIRREDFENRDGFETEIIRYLKENKIDLVVLAGFMRILGKKLVNCYKNKIINIHPALLPAFKGAHGIRDSFEYGAKFGGVTVHFVDEKMDHGPIILQAPVEIKENDTLESFEERIHKQEHKLYPQAIKLVLENKVETNGRKIIRLE